jgi:hypothetical protein
MVRPARRHRAGAATGLLNRINVYPVPDGDTGTNMAMTLSAVDALAQLDSRSAGEVLQRPLMHPDGLRATRRHHGGVPAGSGRRRR